MAVPARGHRVSYDPGLVEEAVLKAEPGLSEEERTAFRLERDHIYDVSDQDEREARFEEFHGRWFLRVGLDRPLHQALAEQPSLLIGARECAVLRAASRQEEMADLVASPVGDPRPALVVRLRPESLQAPERVLAFMRRELMHAADMLDVPFGYEKDLPTSDRESGHDTVLRNRYRVVWDATIDGRLLLRGLLEGSVREVRLAEFAAAFPMLGERTEDVFSGWFDRPFHTHREIGDFIRNPLGTAGGHGRCPVCGFPTARLEPPGRLPGDALRELRRDHPLWRPEQGICVQCADLYIVRHLAG